MSNYDSAPYPNYYFSHTQPAEVGAIAKLFGLKVTNIENANVLEIGCANGSNITPMAARFQKATFTGIDLSIKQIATAKKLVKDLSLDNISFIAASIADHDFGDEKFDYIIAHGVYSWVPQEIQEKILEVCNTQLSENGVAYISYNVLPGWDIIKSVRDMMLFHISNIENEVSDAEQVVEARNILDFISKNMKAGPHKTIFENEALALRGVDDNYLRHDHLEDTNTPCYFYEFISRAAKHNLSYVGDTNLKTMSLASYSPEVIEQFSSSNNYNQREQYFDFINNRRFRSSILVKSHVEVNHNPKIENLNGLAVYPCFLPVNKIDLSQNLYVESVEIYDSNNREDIFEIKGALPCAVYLEIVEALPNSISINKIIEKLTTRFLNIPKHDLEIEIKNLILEYIFYGIFNLTLDDAEAAVGVTNKPEVFSAARVIGQTDAKVPNLNHNTLILSYNSRLVMQYLTGKHTFEEIVNFIKIQVIKGNLNIIVNEEPLGLDHEDFDNLIENVVLNCLKDLKRQGLLVA